MDDSIQGRTPHTDTNSDGEISRREFAGKYNDKSEDITSKLEKGLLKIKSDRTERRKAEDNEKAGERLEGGNKTPLL